MHHQNIVAEPQYCNPPRTHADESVCIGGWGALTLVVPNREIFRSGRMLVYACTVCLLLPLLGALGLGLSLFAFSFVVGLFGK